jgi:glycosyltransferase involved in cell wall biosynthesis
MAKGALRPGRLTRQFSPELQVIHYQLTSNLPPVRLPTVTTLHDLQHHELPELFAPHQRLWRRFVYDRAAARSTTVVTDSHHARARIIELLGVDPDRVVTIHLAVDRERFKPAPDPREEQLLSSLRLADRFVLYPASLWPHKNHRRLLEAFARIGDGTLHLVLTGADFGRLQQLASISSQLGIRDRVRHLGFVSDAVLPALYRRALALVFPSMYEGFGTPPLEAMACGCPVASSLAASLAEVCGDAVEPLDPEDPEQMATAITRVVHDRASRELLRERGFAQVSGFSWSTAAAEHIAVYRKAIGHGA